MRRRPSNHPGVGVVYGSVVPGKANLCPEKSPTLWTDVGSWYWLLAMFSWPAGVLQLKRSWLPHKFWCTADRYTPLSWTGSSRVLWLILKEFSEAFNIFWKHYGTSVRHKNVFLAETRQTAFSWEVDRQTCELRVLLSTAKTAWGWRWCWAGQHDLRAWDFILPL